MAEPLAAEYIGLDPFDGTLYRARKRLRAGGGGHVWLIEERATGCLFAAKLLHFPRSLDPRFVEQLRREAAVTARVDHPNAAKVLGVSATKQGFLFISLEYLEGSTLDDQIAAEGAPHVLETLAWCVQLLSALHAAHAVGIVHRDVKPGNIFVCEPSDGPRSIKLFDFGLARVMPGSPAALDLPPGDSDTGADMAVGTARYMSPEGAMGLPVDERADIYSAGLVLYTMLVGRDPFAHLEDDEVLSAHVSHQPEAPSRLATAPLPLGLDHVVLKAIAKDPSQRFQTAMEFSQELQFIAEQLQRPKGGLETLGTSSGVREIAPEEARATRLRGSRRIGLRAVIGFSLGLAIGGLVVLGLVAAIEVISYVR